MEDLEKIQFDITKNQSLIDAIYPVGSIYFSVNSVNPSTLFGGTWVDFGVGRMIAGIDPDNTNFDTVEKTGGVATHTHTGPSHTHNIASHTHTGPSHTHYMDHTHTGPSHTHYMDHTHTGPSHQHATGDCALTIAQMPKHHHTINYYSQISGNQYQGVHGPNGTSKVGSDWRAINDEGGGAAHNHGATGWAGNGSTSAASAAYTGASGSGATSTASATYTGASGNGATGGSGTLTTTASGTGNTGSSSNLPPYITCYMWKRTA